MNSDQSAFTRITNTLLENQVQPENVPQQTLQITSFEPITSAQKDPHLEDHEFSGNTPNISLTCDSPIQNSLRLKEETIFIRSNHEMLVDSDLNTTISSDNDKSSHSSSQTDFGTPTLSSNSTPVHTPQNTPPSPKTKVVDVHTLLLKYTAPDAAPVRKGLGVQRMTALEALLYQAR